MKLQLTSETFIEELMEFVRDADPTIARQGRESTRAKQSKHCPCGVCKLCLHWEEERKRRAAKYGCPCGHKGCDCAKWNRIFDEKFADPTYYADLPVREPGSALGRSALDRAVVKPIKTRMLKQQLRSAA